MTLIISAGPMSSCLNISLALDWYFSRDSTWSNAESLSMRLYSRALKTPIFLPAFSMAMKGSGTKIFAK